MFRRTRVLLPLLVLLVCLAVGVASAAVDHHRRATSHTPGHTPSRAPAARKHPRVSHRHVRAVRRPTPLARHRARVRREAASVVRFARHFLGVQYVYGGASPSSGFDCSGFTRYVFAHFGVSLPHYTFAQFDLGRRVARSGLRPGDLVFFDGVGHVGLYIGHDRFIHAPHTGTRVSVDRLSGWYSGRYAGARRVIT